MQSNISTTQHENLNENVAIQIVRIIQDQLDELFRIMIREPEEDFDKYYSIYVLSEKTRDRAWKALFPGGASDIRTSPYYGGVNTFFAEKKINLNDDGSFKPSNKDAIKLAIINAKRNLVKQIWVNNKRKIKNDGQSDAKKSKILTTKNNEDACATSVVNIINESKDDNHNSIKPLAESTKILETRAFETKYKDIRECFGSPVKYISNPVSHDIQKKKEYAKEKVIENDQCALENKRDISENQACRMESEADETKSDKSGSINRDNNEDNANNAISLECNNILIEQSDYRANKENIILDDQHNILEIGQKDVGHDKGNKQNAVKNIYLEVSELCNVSSVGHPEVQEKEFTYTVDDDPVDVAKPNNTRKSNIEWRYEFRDAYGHNLRSIIPMEYREPYCTISKKFWVPTAHFNASFSRQAPNGEIVRTYMRDKYGIIS